MYYTALDIEFGYQSPPEPDLSDVTISLSSHSLLLNEQFVLEISVSELQEDWDIISYGFELHYDEEMLEFIGIPLPEFANTLSAPGGMPVYIITGFF